MSRCVVLVSGGIDSAVALAWAHHNYRQLYALSFNYFLRPFRERLSVFRLLQIYPAQLIEPSFPFLKEAQDLEDKSAEGMLPEGYLSNRNMIFYSVAAYYAESYRCEAIVGGHTAEDSQAFPDASQGYFHAIENLLNQGMLSQTVRIEQPLIGMTKLDVLRKAIEWSVPLEYTWSCYWDATEPCGNCISCVERAEALKQLKS